MAPPGSLRWFAPGLRGGSRRTLRVAAPGVVHQQGLSTDYPASPVWSIPHRHNRNDTATAIYPTYVVGEPADSSTIGFPRSSKPATLSIISALSLYPDKYEGSRHVDWGGASCQGPAVDFPGYGGLERMYCRFVVSLKRPNRPRIRGKNLESL